MELASGTCHDLLLDNDHKLDAAKAVIEALLCGVECNGWTRLNCIPSELSGPYRGAKPAAGCGSGTACTVMHQRDGSSPYQLFPALLLLPDIFASC